MFYKIKKHYKKILVSFFLSLFLSCFSFSSFIVSAESDTLNFYDSVYNQIQVGWSDMDDIGTGNSYVYGDSLVSRRNEKLGISSFTSKDYLHYVNGRDNKPSNFSISTMTNSLSSISSPFATISSRYAGTVFSFSIEVYSYCYSDLSSNTVFGTDIEEIDIWKSYMHAKFYTDKSDKTEVLEADNIRFVVATLKDSYFRFVFTYDFIVPDMGVALYGFQFNFPCKFVLGTETDFYVQPVFSLSDIVLNSYNYPLPPIDSNSDSSSFLDAAESLYNKLDFSILNSIPAGYNSFVSAFIYVSDVIEMFFFKIPFIKILIWISMILGCLSFIIGLASRLVSSTDKSSFTTNKVKRR